MCQHAIIHQKKKQQSYDDSSLCAIECGTSAICRLIRSLTFAQLIRFAFCRCRLAILDGAQRIEMNHNAKQWMESVMQHKHQHIHGGSDHGNEKYPRSQRYTHIRSDNKKNVSRFRHVEEGSRRTTINKIDIMELFTLNTNRNKNKIIIGNC